MYRVSPTTAHEPHNTRSHALPETVCAEYLETAKQLYADGRLSLAGLEDALDIILTGETGPRAFREIMEERYEIAPATWFPKLDGCTIYV